MIQLPHYMADTGTGFLSGISDWVVNVMETLGAPGAGLLVMLENLFPPLPSEVILPLAGFTSSKGDMNLVAAIVWTTAGSLAGALILYYVGAVLGRERTRLIASKMPLVRVSDIDKTEAWFLKHETKTVFFGRMIPIFRSFISIPAGIERMNLKSFVTYTLLGSLIWNSAFVIAGYILGENWHVVERYVGFFQNLVIVAVVLAAVVFVIRRLKSKS